MVRARRLVLCVSCERESQPMKTLAPNTQVVTVGKTWESRRFDGLVVEGAYVSKGDARRSSDASIRAEYARARRAFRSGSYSLEDAPLSQTTENGVTVFYHDLKARDI